MFAEDGLSADRLEGVARASIFEIARALVTAQDVETILSEFLARVVENLDAAGTDVLLLYEPGTEELVVAAALGHHLMREELQVVQALNDDVQRSRWLTPVSSAGAVWTILAEPISAHTSPPIILPFEP